MSWFKHNDEVVFTELEDGAVLLNMETRTYYSLNESGAAVWSLIPAHSGPETLTEALQAEFDVDGERAAAAVGEFVAQLRSERLLVEHAEALPLAAERTAATAQRRKWGEPQLIKHDEPLHEVPLTPFDPQLPLAE